LGAAGARTLRLESVVTGLPPGPARGQLRWSYRTGGRITGRPAVGADGAVYVSSHDGQLHALDRHGRLRWKHDLGAVAFAGPLLARGRLHVGTDAGELHVIGTDGAGLRRLAMPGPVERAPAAGPGGLILCAAGRHLVALDDAYRERWRVSAGSKIFGAPVSAAGLIAFGAQDHRLYLVEADGRVRATIDLGFDVDATPVIDPAGVVYVGTDAGRLHAVSARAGAPLWSVQLSGRLRAPLAPVVGQHALLAVSQGVQPALHLIATRTGAVRGTWSLGQTDSPEYFLRSGPSLAAPGRVYVGAPGQRLLAIDATTGELLFDRALGGHMHAPPVLGPDGVLYVGADDGVLRAFADADAN
jgi:outer membrane protein assembly factor BamB